MALPALDPLARSGTPIELALLLEARHQGLAAAATPTGRYLRQLDQRRLTLLTNITRGREPTTERGRRRLPKPIRTQWSEAERASLVGAP